MASAFREKLSELSRERLIDFIEMSNRNFWSLQNNYIVNIEKRYGQDVAIEFDDLAYGRAAEVSVYRLKKFFGLGDDMETLKLAYQLLPWGSYVPAEFPVCTEKKLVRRVPVCTMQMERIKRGAGELPCKPALLPVAMKIAEAVNPKIKVTHLTAPPDPHPDNMFCELVFEMGD